MMTNIIFGYQSFERQIKQTTPADILERYAAVLYPAIADYKKCCDIFSTFAVKYPKYPHPDSWFEEVRLFIQYLREKKQTKGKYFQKTLKTYAKLEPQDANQELLGHADARTTMIYTHCVSSRTLKEAKSLLDFFSEHFVQRNRSYSLPVFP